MYPVGKPPDLDDVGNPIGVEKPPDLDDYGNPSTPEKSFGSQVWEALNAPLLEAPGRWGKQFADWFTTPEADDSWLTATAKGALGGMTQGAGELLSGLSSPLNLGVAAATGGSNVALRAGLPQIARGMSTAGKVASIPMIGHGLERVTSPDATLAERGMGLVEAAGGALGTQHVPKTSGPIVSRLPFGKDVAPAPTPTPGTIPSVIPPPSSGLEQISRLVLKKPTMADITRLTDEGFIAADTTPEGGIVMLRPARMQQQPKVDPNLNQGVGDAELAGSTPYQGTPEVLPPDEVSTWQQQERDLRLKEGRDPDTGAVPEGMRSRDLGDWASWEHYRDAEIEAGRPDPGPWKNDKVMPADIEVPQQQPPGARFAFMDPHNFEVPEPFFHLDDGSTVSGREMDRRGIPRPTEIAPFEPSFFERMRPEEPQRFPGDESFDIGDMSQPIDLNAAILETGSDMAKPVQGRRVPNQLALPEAPPEFMGQVLPNEFAMDMQLLPETRPVMPRVPGPEMPHEFQPDMGVETPIPETGGSSILPAPEAPPIQDIEALPTTLINRLRKFIESEEGEINLGPKGEEPTLTAPTVYVRKPTVEAVKKAVQAGYEFSGEVREDGAWKFNKKGAGGAAPVLESEVAGHRPTTSGARRQLGAVTDIQKQSKLVEAFNLPRGLMASIDFSAPLRQGIGLIHKKEFWNAMPEMFKAWASEEGFQASQKAISDKALFQPRSDAKGKVYPSFAEDAGLKLTDLTDLTKREEAIMSTWAEKVPGVRRSNRAYTAFLNNLRAHTFESLVRDSKVFGADAKANLPLARELAKFVNTASGRGSLGKLESSAVALNSVLFSPRLISSRLTMLNPHYYITANPAVRKEALKSLFTIAAVGNTLTQLGKMAGGEVSMDPTSSDFGKLKIGNTRLDPYGGFQQYIVAASRLLSGKVTSSNTGEEFDLFNPQRPFDPNHMDVIERFGRGKLHPVLGFAYSLLKGQRDMAGKKMDFTSTNPMENSITQMFIPLLAQDLYELAQKDATLLPIIGPLVGLGMGTQTYSPDE
jgi:hypothetical protein